MMASRYFPLVLAGFVPVLMFIIVAQTPVEPWGDEAMLLSNLLLPNLDILAPMPHYEQAAPVGYTWLARTLLDTFGHEPPFHVLRFLSATFVGLGIVFLLALRPIRRDAVASAVLLTFLLGEPMLWTYANEIKHYSAEFFASAMILACGLPLARRDDAGALAMFLLAAVIAGLVSFTVPVVVAGILLGLFIYRLTGNVKARAFAPGFIITGVLAVLYLGAMYLFLNRDLVAWQVQAYSHVYNPGSDQGAASLVIKRVNGVLQAIVNASGATWLSMMQRLLHQIGLPIGLSFHAIRVIPVILLGVLAWIARRRAPAVVMVALSVFAATAILQMSGFLNLAYPRHAIFLIPFIAVLVAIGVSLLLHERLSPFISALFAGVVLVAALSFGAGSALGRQTQDVGKLLAHIHNTAPDVPVWIHSDGQAIFELISPRPTHVLGEMDKSSGPTAWQIRGGAISLQDGAFITNPDYPNTIATAAAGQTELWLLFTNDAFGKERASFIAIASKTVGPCKPVSESPVAGLYFCTQAASQ